MDYADEPTSPDGAYAGGGTKRKRSLSTDAPLSSSAPPAKTAKPHHPSYQQINYLARQYADILPLVSIEDPMPQILQLLADYGAVLDRHESLAGNLGARPLGPILIKRFERLFDGSPRVLKTHAKDAGHVTWLDVVEFARHKPEQFNLEKMRDGVRVCQFYTKQSRVEISEEDYMLISSGMPQKLIPPQPIAEDEEKELGTLEIMEKRLGQVIQLADQLSARTRQFKHRLIARRTAIAARRESEPGPLERAASLDKEGAASDGTTSAASGFVAVNNSGGGGRPRELQNGSMLSALSNGKQYAAATASPTTKAELLAVFNGQRERAFEQADLPPSPAATAAVQTSSSSRSHKKSSRPAVAAAVEPIDYASILLNSASPVPIPSTPSNLVPYPRQSQQERYDDSGPYKAEMLSRMEEMHRGDRVMPPCDRCRRLHMDCLKNLTACLGCTKKHAKCSWKDVTEQELIDHPRTTKSAKDETEGSGIIPLDGPPQPVRDEELLGEDDSDEDEDDDSEHAPRDRDSSGRIVLSYKPPASSSSGRAADAGSKGGDESVLRNVIVKKQRSSDTFGTDGANDTADDGASKTPAAPGQGQGPRSTETTKAAAEREPYSPTSASLTTTTTNAAAATTASSVNKSGSSPTTSTTAGANGASSTTNGYVTSPTESNNHSPSHSHSRHGRTSSGRIYDAVKEEGERLHNERATQRKQEAEAEENTRNGYGGSKWDNGKDEKTKDVEKEKEKEKTGDVSIDELAD